VLHCSFLSRISLVELKAGGSDEDDDHHAWQVMLCNPQVSLQSKIEYLYKPFLTLSVPPSPLRLRRSLDSLRSKSYEAVGSSSESIASTKTSLSAKTTKSIKKLGRKLIDLPGAIRGRASSSLKRLRSRNTTTLSIINEEEDPIPEIDHDFDLNVTLSASSIQEDLDAALEVLMPAMGHEDENYPTKKLDPAGPPFLWFKLPVKVKRQIYGLLFPPEQKKISLSKNQFTKAVFPDWYFISPWDVLDDVWGPLGSCKAWRKEVMAYFWSQYHFHITLNEFTLNRLTSPLSHIWVQPYLHLIQRLTIERDYTRLAGSHHKGAVGLCFGISKKIQITVNVLVAKLLSRNGMSMAEFHLMGRKYAGYRPADHCPDSSNPGIYPWTLLLTAANPISAICSVGSRRGLRWH
jgi:hypothetical protein